MQKRLIFEMLADITVEHYMFIHPTLSLHQLFQSTFTANLIKSDLKKPKPHGGGEEDRTENTMDCTDSCSKAVQEAKDNITNLLDNMPKIPADIDHSNKIHTLDSRSEAMKGCCGKSDSNTSNGIASGSCTEDSKASCTKRDDTNEGPMFSSQSEAAKGVCAKSDGNTNERPNTDEGLSFDTRSEDSKKFCVKSAETFQGCSRETQKEALCGPGERGNGGVVSGRFNLEVVQIKAQKAEIDRRIMAFIERKQAEINENNVREFCNVIQCNQENSCARTDAVFTPYPGFKSRVKVSRVVNTYGPLTRPERGPASNSKTSTLTRDCGNQAVEERLQNMEAHLCLQTGGPVPKDVYQRIKRLEEKILELEGISPEYFQTPGFSGKRRKLQAQQSCSLVEIDDKIVALREKLARKVGELHSRNGDKFRG